MQASTGFWHFVKPMRNQKTTAATVRTRRQEMRREINRSNLIHRLLMTWTVPSREKKYFRSPSVGNVSGAAKLSLRLQPLHHARKRHRLAYVMGAAYPGYRSLD